MRDAVCQKSTFSPLTLICCLFDLFVDARCVCCGRFLVGNCGVAAGAVGLGVCVGDLKFVQIEFIEV